MSQYLPQQRYQLLSNWLGTADPDQWHQVAQSWNWDNGTSVLEWIVKQPDCDKATALHLFWLSDPSWNLGALDFFGDSAGKRSQWISLETIELQVIILRRCLQNDFHRQEIAWKGWKGLGSVKECFGRFAHIVPIALLEDMARPLPGRQVERGDFDEGIPNHIIFASLNN